MTELPTHVRVAIIGAGFAGLGAAIRLRSAGLTVPEDLVVLERADDLGGTWRDNTYPGVACDVQSHLYSFSFAPNPSWSRTFSGGPEIWDYLRGVAASYGVLPSIRCGVELIEAAWDDEAARWRLSTSRGSMTADVLVSAMGALSEPSLPAIPGLADFPGTVFHSAQWRHDHDLTGERIAVIGTGASAIQFVPQIQPRVGRLTVFQRTAPWVVPRPDRPIRDVERRLYRRLPALQRAVRGAIYTLREVTLVPGLTRDRRWLRLAAAQARKHLATQVPDPELRATLTPTYTIGCKRILVSDDYYPALAQDNVEVIAGRVAAVHGSTLVTDGGVEREVDTIILATGFHVTDMPAAERLRGADGRLLSEVWAGSPAAFVGTTIAGFPNLFMLVGPNTGLGHNSMIYMIESQLAYLVDAVRQMSALGVAAVDVRPEVQAAYDVEVQGRMRSSVWTTGGCASWYLDPAGRNTTLWPDFTWRFRRRTRRFDLADYRVRPAAPSVLPVLPGGQPARPGAQPEGQPGGPPDPRPAPERPPVPA